MTITRKSLPEYLALQYTLQVVADPDGGYVVLFPDLPGCMTQAEELAEVPTLAEEARKLWLTTAYERGIDIPLPSYPEEYSGKFNVRLPKSLHRRLVEGAERQGVSLNQYVVDLLARGEAKSSSEGRLEALEGRLGERLDRLAEQVAGLQFPMTQTPFPGDQSVKLKPARRSARARSYGETVGA